ncbi:unnamed protein product, partial [Iphiclides podalirius]
MRLIPAESTHDLRVDKDRPVDVIKPLKNATDPNGKVPRIRRHLPIKKRRAENKPSLTGQSPLRNIMQWNTDPRVPRQNIIGTSISPGVPLYARYSPCNVIPNQPTYSPYPVPASAVMHQNHPSTSCFVSSAALRNPIQKPNNLRNHHRYDPCFY